jgi:hypothetical protein
METDPSRGGHLLFDEITPTIKKHFNITITKKNPEIHKNNLVQRFSTKISFLKCFNYLYLLMSV